MGLNVELHQLSDAMEIMARKVGLTDFSVQFSAVEAVPSTMLAPEEEALAALYRPARLATFLAGRSCAHRALAALGMPSTAILRDAGGAPIWPAGFTGSIAHTQDIAAALVARDALGPTIGIDLETDQPLEDIEILDIVCHPDEIAIRDRQGTSCLDQGKIYFVAKEATYKALWPVHKTYLDFKDVILRFHGDSGEFSAHLSACGSGPATVNPAVLGSYTRLEGHYVAIAYSAAFRSDGATNASRYAALTEKDNSH